MYGADIDLSYRIQKSGYKNFYLPTTSIIHYKGESTKKTSVNYIITFYKAMITFVKKHYDKKKANPLIFLIKTAILIRASLSIIKRIFLKLTYPLIDIIIMFFSIYYLKDLWSYIRFDNQDYYNNELLLKFGIPIYIFFWLSGIVFKKGYSQPVKITNVLKGMTLGTIALLIVYSLLPESLRFSRALIILGSISVTIAIIMVRYLIHLLPLTVFKIDSNRLKKIAIVAKNDEFQRISKIINKDNANTKIIGQINDNQKNKDSLGSLQQLQEIITIYKLNEIIFSAKDTTAKEIMEYMSQINSKIDIKIAPTESTFIIGSNSIHAQGDLYSLENTLTQKNSIKTFFKKYIDFFN